MPSKDTLTVCSPGKTYSRYLGPRKDAPSRYLGSRKDTLALFRAQEGHPEGQSGTAEVQKYVHLWISNRKYILNDLLKTRLSRCRMIWLLPHPFPHSPISLPVCRRSSLLRGEEGGRRWGRSQII
jgi:hypothetical protein